MNASPTSVKSSEDSTTMAATLAYGLWAALPNNAWSRRRMYSSRATMRTVTSAVAPTSTAQYAVNRPTLGAP
jgi:hypothetical protein